MSRRTVRRRRGTNQSVGSMSMACAKHPATRLGLMAVLTGGLLLLSGCLPIWEANKMRDRIEELEGDQTELQEDLRKQEEELEQMVADARQDVQKLKKVLSQARELLQRNSADLGAELQEARQEVQKLRGQIEEAEFKLGRLEQDLESYKRDVDQRFAQGGFLANIPEKPEELYQFGKKRYDAGEIAAARQIFRTFLETHSDHNRADSAQYYKAMTFVKQGSWKKAVYELRDVVQKYRNSTHRAGATYHIGLGFMHLDRCKQARGILQSVIEKYPGSEWDSEARQNVRAIDNGNCPP